MREETRADLSSSSFSSFIFARHRVRSRKISPRKRIFSNFSLFPPGFNIGRKQAALALFLAIFHIAPDSISNSKSPRKKISFIHPSFFFNILLYYAFESFLPLKKRKNFGFSLQESINFKHGAPFTAILCRVSLYCLRAISQDNDPCIMQTFLRDKPFLFFFSKGRRETTLLLRRNRGATTNMVYYREMELLYR